MVCQIMNDSEASKFWDTLSAPLNWEAHMCAAVQARRPQLRVIDQQLGDVVNCLIEHMSRCSATNPAPKCLNKHEQTLKSINRRNSSSLYSGI